MKLTFSELERGILAMVCAKGWAGADILVRAEMHKSLNLGEFTKDNPSWKPSQAQRPYKLHPEAAEHLLNTLATIATMPQAHALALVPAVKRVKAALARLPKPKKAAGP